MIIVIDGPAGSGKSTTAKAVADKMNLQYLDSGALYRAVTRLFIESGARAPALFNLLNQVSITFRYDNGTFRVFIDDEEVTSRLRTTEISQSVSEVAALDKVRSFVNNLMHEVVNDGIYIAEGRDLGTAVFPDAEVKFFMSADAHERAERRYKELKKKGIDISTEEVRQNILNRDKKDSRRAKDPLKKADDAIGIDTTNLTFEQQVTFICSVIEDKLKATNH